MESHTRAKSLSEHPEKTVAQHPWGAALGALDLIADVSFSGASMWFCFYLSAWSRGAATRFWLSLLLFGERGRDGWVARYAIGVLFLLFHDVALLLSDEGTWESFWGRPRGQASQWGTGTRLNVSFLYSGSRATGVLAHGVPWTSSLTHKFPRIVLHACLHTGDVVVNKKLGKQKLPVSNHPEVNSRHNEEKFTVLSEKNWCLP